MSTEPKYLHPSVTSKIIDTSSVVLTAAGLNNMFVALEAEKGAPNEAMYISSASQFIFTLGEPNFAKWGQAGMNAMNWLRAGGGLWVIRVVPDDETFASLSLGIGYNDSETYTNDEEEYKNLELTADQIKLWNFDVATDDEARKYARGLSTGATVPVEKFYAGKVVDGKIINVESKLGTMTKDAISLYNRGNGYTDDNDDNALKALAIKKEVTVHFGMSYADNLLVEGATRHLREKYRYDKYNISSYIYMRIEDFKISSEAGVLRQTPENHSSNSGIETLFASTSFEAFKVQVDNCRSVLSYSVDTDDNGIFTINYVLTSTDNFENLFLNGDPQTTVSTDPNILNVPKSLKATYEITKNASTGYTMTYTKAADDINAIFVPTNIGDITSDTGSLISTDVPNQNIVAGTMAIGPEDLAALEALSENNPDLYGPCYERLYDDALTAFSTCRDGQPLKNTNVKLTVMSSEAEWQNCYEVFYKDGTPVKIAAMTENYIRWYNHTAPSYAKVREIDPKRDIPSTGIYERVKTFNVNYALSGEPVYGFYMTDDAMEIFNTTKAENRREVTVSGEITAETVLKSMVENTETIFNQTAIIAYTIQAGSNTELVNSIKAFSYLAPLFKFEVEDSENEGYKLLTASLKATDVFADVRLRSLSEDYQKNIIDAKTKGFAATSTNKDLKNIGLYTATGELNTDAVFTVPGIEVPEVIAKILSNIDTTNAQIPLVNGYTENYGVPVWNIIPSVNVASVGNEYSLSIKVSFYATANAATLIKLDDLTGIVYFKSASISEYTHKQNYTVVYEDSGFVPNSEYIENTYKAIGFCTTTFTNRADDNISHEEKTPVDFKRGYAVDENRVTINSVDDADIRLSSTRFVEFARFLPKGSGPWYNRLAVSLTYENAYNNTYPDWSMFTLSVIEKSNSSEVVRESFDVALDPDAISGTKESLFIEDVVNRYSSYLTCVVNYDNLQNFIDTKLKITDSEGNPIKDEDGNEIVPSTDKVIKYIFNQITLDELNVATFGEDYQNSEYADDVYKDLMSAIGYDSQLCHLDTTLNDSTGAVTYNDPFVSEFYYQTVDTNAVFYLAGGTRGHGWGYETIDPDTDETVTTATLTQALTRAYNGTTDPLVTNTQTCVFDIMMDANYDITVKDAMSDLAALTRGDCITILDMNHDCANASQAVAKRKDQMQYNTYFTSIFSQTLGINDEWTGKPVRVTPTFFLATKIPQNDAAYTEIYNFVGPRRGTIAGFRDVSWLPTEPEKTELYKNQINYIEQDTQATMFATENTSQKITSPLSMIHAVRSLLKLKRQMEQTARNYRMEFSTDDIRGHLQEALNNIANNKVLAGGYDYISPVVSASAYDRQQKICRVKVDLAFTDIMERFVFEFVVNRAS